MKQLAIKAENISKQYRLGEVGTGTISHDLNRFWHKIRGNEDPYLKIGESNDRTRKGDSDYVWSLRDINFEIEQGDAVGIIGRNGAGKSTLLKLLSKVTKPTTGNFKVNGRIASLLEVGTGFNPEMTGRENIYLNGAILGMRRAEITRKFDEIVDFAGVERYIDTPVKRYSSGMYVRLAFAVAAHLESEILIVDEVLAVGDAEFQKKCLGKMGDVSKKEGRTVLFVSHNLSSVRELCTRGLVMKNGCIGYQGEIEKCLIEYRKNQQMLSGYNYLDYDRYLENQNIKVKYLKAKPITGNIIDIKSGVRVTVVFENRLRDVGLDMSFFVKNSQDINVFSTGLIIALKSELVRGDYMVEFDIPPYTLNEDAYHFDMFWGINRKDIAYRFDDFSFEVLASKNRYGEVQKSAGIMAPNIEYSVEKL